MHIEPVSFRPSFGRILSVVVVAIMLSAIVGFVVAGDLEGALRFGWWYVLVAVLAVVTYWNPSVDVSQGGVTVRNPFSSWTVPWGAIQRIDTKFALTLYTAERRVEAWAAPASGRFTVFRLGPDDVRVSESAKVAGAIRPGDTLNSESGQAADYIRRHWERLRDDGELDVGPSEITRSWHVTTIAIVAALLLAGITGATL